MWILQFLPNWIFYVIFFAGLLGLAATYFLKYIPIPAIYMYKTPIQLGSVAAIVFATFMTGAIWDNEAWVARVKEMEAKVAAAEQESKDANDKLAKKVDTHKVKIVEKQVVLKEYVDREVVKYDNTCVIPKEFIDVVNKSTDDIRK